MHTGFYYVNLSKIKYMYNQITLSNIRDLLLFVAICTMKFDRNDSEIKRILFHHQTSPNYDFAQN